MPSAFPLADPVGPVFDGLDAARDTVARIVAPGARDADRGGVRRQTLDALAAAGLLGAPLAPPAAMRELGELLAGSDASTWFTWVQHQTPLRILAAATDGPQSPAATALAHDLLPGMSTGRLVAAVAFAHVRRPGAPNPTATRTAAGWVLDGTLDWVTSWDVADVVMVMAQGTGADAHRLVCGYLPAGRSDVVTPGLSAGEPLHLLAMGGTHTRPVRLDGVLVPWDRVGAVLDRADWLEQDRVASAGATPGAFGVIRGALADLDALATRRGDAGLRELADQLVGQARRLRSAAYSAVDAPPDDDVVAERLRTRAESLDLAVRATTAVVVAMAGAAMTSGTDVERRVREAMFLQVQAQTPATRAAAVALMRSRAVSAGS